MLKVAKWCFLATAISLVALQSDGNFIHEQTNGQSRGLLDWIGLGTGPEVDPYVAKTNAGCLNGDLAECFKSQALSSFAEFFNKPRYHINDNARIIRMPDTQLRHLAQEPYEYSDTPRSEEPEWDQLVKFGMRKIEKFLKSTAIELDFSNDVTEQGRYSPRFLTEVADELDVIQDKKDSLFNRKRLQKLFIPLLIILKLFKLKLLLFLPLILGLSSFKNLLGFFAIIVPGIIAFFKLCKPNLSSPFAHGAYQTPQYTPAGIGYNPYYKDNSGYAEEYGHNHYDEPSRQFAFKNNQAQDIAYSGYSHYRNKDSNVEAQEETPKKSILPDS
ncbi:Protein of unknown function (DUF1676) [Popillia japonica]|uniref:Osiris 2 n=1 Tax=Popillia japonica TaxID=7064 RepID=A0AAW1ISR2_POPJA